MKIWSKRKPPWILNDPDEADKVLKQNFIRHIQASYPTLPGWCPYCLPRTGKRNFAFDLAWRRRNAMYNDDKQNWILSCEECFDEDTENFNEMWADYYSSRL